MKSLVELTCLMIYFYYYIIEYYTRVDLVNKQCSVRSCTLFLKMFTHTQLLIFDTSCRGKI